ncbi:hypothetical protein [Streptomyces sp. NPDC059009]|uniref:hypothetical protein n=1 Tax=Streptomyces sp. NPDC059009 TaxID=3346694 RepID=UPI0036C0CEC1
MRKSLRTGVIALAATATLGASAATALACEQPTGPETSTVAKKQTKRTYVKTVKLRGGMTAKVYKLSKGYQAEIWLGKSHLGTLTAVNKAAVTINDGVYVKLTPNGTVTSWQSKAPANKTNKPVKKDQRKTHKDNKNKVRPGKPGKPSVKPEICPPGPTPEICPPGPVTTDLTDPANTGVL